MCSLRVLHTLLGEHEESFKQPPPEPPSAPSEASCALNSSCFSWITFVFPFFQVNKIKLERIRSESANPVPEKRCWLKIGKTKRLNGMSKKECEKTGVWTKVDEQNAEDSLLIELNKCCKHKYLWKAKLIVVFAMFLFSVEFPFIGILFFFVPISFLYQYNSLFIYVM